MNEEPDLREQLKQLTDIAAERGYTQSARWLRDQLDSVSLRTEPSKKDRMLWINWYQDKHACGFVQAKVEYERRFG